VMREEASLLGEEASLPYIGVVCTQHIW
jgi:hypothetical protein